MVAEESVRPEKTAKTQGAIFRCRLIAHGRSVSCARCIQKLDQTKQAQDHKLLRLDTSICAAAILSSHRDRCHDFFM